MKQPQLNLILDTGSSFAMIEKNGIISVYQGEIHETDALIDIHLLSKKHNSDIVFVLPYRAIQEKGCVAKGDEPILAMLAKKTFSLPCKDFIQTLPVEDVELEGEIIPSQDDEAFAVMVRKFQKEAIEKGLCSQTTLSRTFSGKIADFSIVKLLSLYRRLLEQPGHYMTVLFANINHEKPEESSFILAGTPERHLEISGNETIMCPIAGTLRKEDRETFPERLENFMRDPKEINELFQVLDEEMKMMGAVCPKGGIIRGPFLHEVGAVVHSEYMLIGRRSTHAIDALRATLHAPTVVGSPLVSAARLIAEYEPDSRRYYAGEIGIYRQPRTDVPDGDIDCGILIRGAEIFSNGSFSIQAGAGIVRDSDPESEAQETRAKALGILNILARKSDSGMYLTDDLKQRFCPLLKSRNAALAAFWQSDQGSSITTGMHDEKLKNLHVTIINNEDNFAFMLAHMIRALGVATIDVVDTFAFDSSDKSNIVMLGPGPGDPADMSNPRMQHMQNIISELKFMNKPILGICLGHQALAYASGLPVLQQKSSTQGMPRRVRIMGSDYVLGFYNSFSPVLDESHAPFDIDLDENRRIIALRGTGIVGYQFHPESVMSVDGEVLLRLAFEHLLKDSSSAQLNAVPNYASV